MALRHRMHRFALFVVLRPSEHFTQTTLWLHGSTRVCTGASMHMRHSSGSSGGGLALGGESLGMVSIPTASAGWTRAVAIFED